MNPAITIVKSLALASCLALVACGGSSSSSTPPAASTSLSGTAAAGAALIGTVTVKGALGVTRSAIIEANGNYNVDVTGLTAPYRLRAQGTVGGRTYKLHSYAEEADVGGNVNITPFTDLIVANAAQQIAESFFDSDTTTSLDPAVVDAQEDALQAKLQNVLTALGVDSAINLLNSTFSADHSGLDAALDIVRVEIDTATNIATLTNLIENTFITDNVLDDTDNSETLTVTDTTVLTGAVTDTQAIAALFENFGNAFSNGLPTTAAIEDFLSDDFLENDFSKGLFLTDVTTDPSIIGLGFTGITVSELDSTAGTAIVSFNAYIGDDIDPETVTWFVAKDATLGWQLRGDQRIVDINTLSYHCNDFDGTDNETGGCGINVSFFDEDFTNNGTSGSPIASATVAIIDGSNQSTVKGIVYLGTPDFAAPGELQIYNASANVSSAGFYTGDFRGFGTATNEIDPSIFSPGDIVEYKLFTQDLDVTDPTDPTVAAGTEVATYTTTILFEPSLTGLYPAATTATLTAIQDFALLGNDLTIAWTLQDGTISDEVLVEISDDQGNRFEVWDESFSGSATTTTFSSTDLSSTAASAAGLDQNASTYTLLVRIYAADSVTGQFHSTDYRATIPGPGTPTGLSFNPANIPGTYDTLWSDNPIHHEFIFNADSTGTVDFGFGLEPFIWSIDSQGRLLVDLGSGALPDRYTLTSGTIKSGTLSAEVDDDSNGVYEAFPTIDIVETAGGGSTLTCSYESGWDDAADGGFGAPINPNSFADYETVVTACGTAQAFTVADVAGDTYLSDGESVSFNNSAGAGTEGDPKTGVFTDTVDNFTFNFEWYVEAATCSGCTHSYLVLFSDQTIASNLPIDSLRETTALIGIVGSNYSYVKYTEQPNFGDMVRETGSDGEIWNSVDVLQP